MFNFGRISPHPAFYCRCALFERHENYRLDYGRAADYELMLIFINTHRQDTIYISKVMVKTVVGGIGNKSLSNRVQATRFDLKAMRKNDILLPVLTVLFKPLREMAQFI